MLGNRKRARRFRLLWPLVLTIVVLVVLGIGRITDTARATVAFLETARKELARIDGDTTTLRGILQGLAIAKRADFTRLMNSIEASLNSAEQALGEEDPGADLALSAALLGRAIDSWQMGMTDLEGAIITAVDNAEDQDAAGQVADALLGLTVGDRFYQIFVTEANERQQELSLNVDLPEVRYGMPSGGASTEAAKIVTSARFSAEMQLRPDLQIVQVMTEPAWETNPDNNLVLPFTTETLTVSVVVKNDGNAIAPAGDLLWSLRPESEEQVEGKLDRPGLEPGDATTVVIEGLKLKAGTRYRLHIELTPLDNEENLDENQRNYNFDVNEAPE